MGAYIINIPDSVDRVVYINVDPMDGKTYLASYSVDDLTPYTEPDLEQVRKEAYEQGRKDVETQFCSYDACKNRQEEYQRGLADAWEAAKKIAYMYSEERKKIFGENLIQNIHDIYSASEAVEKIRQYEQEKEEQKQLQVGDEVIRDSGKAVVMAVGPVYFKYFCADGSDGFDFVKSVKKTGRTFPEIAEILRKMRKTE